MKIIYPDYSEESISDRKISKKLVEDALLNPDEVIESKKGRKIAHKVIGHRLLRVVYKESKKAYIVVTAYYTEPKRYMKNENNL